MHAEARPLIDHFGLKQDTTSHAVPVYHSESIVLTVSGIGKLKSSVSTTWLFTRPHEIDKTIAINIGIAGCTEIKPDDNLQIGNLFLINKIIDFATGRELYPDILIDTHTEEATLTTVDRPLDRSDGVEVADGLVDMEASGFYQAAATFLPPHHIACVKIISDFLKVERFDRSWVSNLIGTQISTIEKIIEGYHTVADLSRDVLQAEDTDVLDQIRKSLRLTLTQYKLLTDWARGYKLHTKQPLPDLSVFTQAKVSDKYEGKKHLERLRERFMAT